MKRGEKSQINYLLILKFNVMKTIKEKNEKKKKGQKRKKENETTTSKKSKSQQHNKKEKSRKIKKRIDKPVSDKFAGKQIAGFKKGSTEVKYLLSKQKSNHKPSLPKVKITPVSEETENNVIGDVICTTQEVEETVENADQYILSPLSSIWLGAAMDLNDLNKGVYTNNTEQRYPITISSSFGYDGHNFIKVEKPKRSTVHDATVKLKNQRIIENPGTNTRIDLFEVHSAEQLKVHFGAEAQLGMVNINGSSDFNFSTTKRNFMAVFQQIFYTEFVDSIDKKRMFKNREATENDIYVSSISWGRMVLLTIETSATEQEINAMLEASYASTKAELEAKHSKTIESSTIKGYVYGGGAEDATALLTDFSQLYDFIKNGSQFDSSNNPGSPIVYRFTSPGTNSQVDIITSTKYPQQVCIPYTGKFEVEITNIEVFKKNVNKNLNIYGTISLKGYTRKVKSTSGSFHDSTIAWNKDKKNAVKLGEGDKHKIVNKKVICFDKLTEIDDKASYIEIKADLSEKEGLKGEKGEKLGVETKKIFLYDLPNYASGANVINDDNYLVINDGKGRIRVNFKIKSLNSY